MLLGGVHDPVTIGVECGAPEGVLPRGHDVEHAVVVGVEQELQPVGDAVPVAVGGSDVEECEHPLRVAEKVDGAVVVGVDDILDGGRDAVAVGIDTGEQ